MKLNPTKCVFCVPACKLLGFLVSERSIKANSDKIKAITSLGKLANINQAQRMAGHIAALRRYISHLGEKVIPVYQLLKKTDNFVWTDAPNEDFEALEKELVEPPVLAASTDKEPMLHYIAANSKVVNVAVVIERKEEGIGYTIQWPVYFVSEVLTLSKQRYPHWQKLVFVIFMASWKLKHYFQEHRITVVSSAPIGDII